jgi:hypothetical protein
MEPFTASLATALSTGALAVAKDAATDAVKAGYKALKEFVLKHVGTAKPAVDSLEAEMRRDEPQPAEAEEALKKSLEGLAATSEATSLVQELIEALESARAAQPLIDVDRLRAAKNIILEDIEHSGQLLRSKDVVAEDGDFHVKGIRQVGDGKKKTE